MSSHIQTVLTKGEWLILKIGTLRLLKPCQFSICSLHTFILSSVDGVKLGVDIAVEVELGHADDLLNRLLKTHILRHVGCRGDMKDHLGSIDGAQDPLFCQLSPHTRLRLYLILRMDIALLINRIHIIQNATMQTHG